MTAPAVDPPVVGPEVLEGFQPSDLPGDPAAGTELGAPPVHHAREASPPRPISGPALAATRDRGTRLPSPWSLAGFVPVAVLVGSGAYSAWWRRRLAVPA